MFKRLIRRIINWATRDDIGEDRAYSTLPSSFKNSAVPITDHNAGLTFTVYNAAGGKIIHMYFYDRKTDKSISNLHIITDKEDLGEELALIITREAISR